jgi:hypothetical protein
MNFKEVSIPKTALITVLGVSLIISVITKQSDISLAIAGGLVGYLSKDIIPENNVGDKV